MTKGLFSDSLLLVFLLFYGIFVFFFCISNMYRWFVGPQVTLLDCLSAFFSADELKGLFSYYQSLCLHYSIEFCEIPRGILVPIS